MIVLNLIRRAVNQAYHNQSIFYSVILAENFYMIVPSQIPLICVFLKTFPVYMFEKETLAVKGTSTSFSLAIHFNVTLVRGGTKINKFCLYLIIYSLFYVQEIVSFLETVI